jgi:hypothetical protein
MANRDDAHATFKRADQLHSRGLMSQVDYDSAETRLQMSIRQYRANDARRFVGGGRHYLLPQIKWKSVLATRPRLLT